MKLVLFQGPVKVVKCRIPTVRIPCRGSHGERFWRAVGFLRACRHTTPRKIRSAWLPRHPIPLPQRGIILIALLWVLTALSLIALNLASTVRSEVYAAQASGEAEKAYFFARGGLEEALYRMIFPDKDLEKQKSLFPYAGGMNHYWVKNEEMVCHVAVLDETGKIDLNYTEEETLRRLLENIGVKESLAFSIAKAIIEWREPSKREPSKPFEDTSHQADGKIKHRPFSSVEELLLVEGMNREILYGMGRRDREGKFSVQRGLGEFVTVYSGQRQININYADPEVIAALPGLDRDLAESIIQARTKEPFKTGSDLSQRFTGLIKGETLSLLTTEFSTKYCLVATAYVKGSNGRRSIKLIAKRDGTLKWQHERLMWYDEYWPQPQLLKWTEVKPEVGEETG